MGSPSADRAGLPDAPARRPWPSVTVELVVDGVTRVVEDESQSLLAALREELGVRSPKDGCSPQGQCGCCTVLVDGVARVSCVTAVRRVAGRQVTTADGLDPAVAGPIAEALLAHGGSQCGFCTPGIICRLAGLGPQPAPDRVTSALLAHLCRCTGWRGIIDAALAWRPAAAGAVVPAAGAVVPGAGAVGPGPAAAPRLAAADRRAALEGGAPQHTGVDTALGRGGFADDTAPPGALVAVPDAGGGWAVGATLADARRRAGKRQGRRSGKPLRWPLEPPPGDWALTLQTTWVEPAYLEPDASWCEPGGPPAPPAANGGAFGGKLDSPVASAARDLADRHGRAVRALLTREDVVRRGPKRPPMAIALRADGTGVLRVARTPGIAAAVEAAAPSLAVEELEVAGPPTSVSLRAVGWAETAAALAGLSALTAGRVGAGPGRASVRSPAGATATAEVTFTPDGAPAGVTVEVSCGELLDAVVLRSYVTGATHMALGWVCSEGIAIGEDGEPEDLTIRSFGVLRAGETPPVEVILAGGRGPAVNGSDAAFAAVAAAAWIALGLPPRWPVLRARWHPLQQNVP